MTNTRAVLFIATQARLDARKTSNTVKCKPPNKKCGRRCIPAEWDCRIKGEGHDNHQRATNFDPLSGAANIQRGTKRVVKGVVTGNVAEVEGGTRAIKRGIVKTIPGDVEKKKKVRESLDKNTRNLTIGLALVTGGFALHNVMKRGWPAYANGPGRQLDDSVRASASAVMDRIPGLGGVRAQQRAQAQNVGTQVAYRISNLEQRGPDALTRRMADVPETVRNGGIGHIGRNNVLAALNRTAEAAVQEGQSFDDWRRNSREAVLNTTVSGRSVFADDAAYSFLAQQHGITGSRTGSLDNDVAYLKTHMAGTLANQSQALKRDAINQGFNINATGRDGPRQRNEARTRYIQQIIRRDFPGAPVQFQNQVSEQLRQLISRPDGHDFTNDAAKLYRDTRTEFNSHFRALADYASVFPGDRARPEQRNLIEHINIVHAQVLHTRLPGALRDVPVAGPSHAEFIQRYSYDISVMGSGVSTPSPRVIKAAAEDMAGHPMSGVNAARDYLRQQGYTRLSVDTATSPPRTARRGDAKDHPSTVYMAAYHTKAISSLIFRVGLTGGAGILAYKTAKEGDLNNSIWLGMIAAMGVGSVIREQQVTKDAKQLTVELNKLKKAPGVEAETIDTITKFISDTDLDVQRVGSLLVMTGVGGYFTTDKPNRVHTTGNTHKHSRTFNSKDPIDAMDNGLKRFMEDRNQLPPQAQDARNIKDMEKFKENFSVSGYVGNSTGASMVTTIHEIGHAIHYRGDFATPAYVIVKGKKYEGDELTAELMRSTSIYGQSDIRRAANPQKGNRLETFTENFVLYAANGNNMKEQFPVSYAWTKATLENSISKPPLKPARPMKDVIEELSAGTERFDPKKALKGQKVAKDSADEDRFFTLYREMQEAATAGDILKAITILARAQTLPQEQKQMIGVLMETVCLYRSMRK